MAEWDIREQRVVITGATHGIGLAAAQELARLGAEVAIVARDPARGAAAAEAIQRFAGAPIVVDVLHADLTVQQSVRDLAAQLLERYPRIHVLINNAGAIFATRTLTEDGVERTWALNHLAPFLLTALLRERLIASAPARIVTTTSDAHKNRLIPFDDLNAEHLYAMRGFARYGQTKLANILFTMELARRLQGSGVTANCVHPGLVATGFNRNNGPLMSGVMVLLRPFSRNAPRGAETLAWLAASPDVAGESGGYFVDKRRATPSKAATDAKVARRLWEISERQTRTHAPA